MSCRFLLFLPGFLPGGCQMRVAASALLAPPAPSRGYVGDLSCSLTCRLQDVEVVFILFVDLNEKSSNIVTCIIINLLQFDMSCTSFPSGHGILQRRADDDHLKIRDRINPLLFSERIRPIRHDRCPAYFPRWYNGALHRNAICTGPPPAVRGPARASAPALRFLGVSDRGSAFNREVRPKSLCKSPVRLWLPWTSDV